MHVNQCFGTGPARKRHWRFIQCLFIPPDKRAIHKESVFYLWECHILRIINHYSYKITKTNKPTKQKNKNTPPTSKCQTRHGKSRIYFPKLETTLILVIFFTQKDKALMLEYKIILHDRYEILSWNIANLRESYKIIRQDLRTFIDYTELVFEI